MSSEAPSACAALTSESTGSARRDGVVQRGFGERGAGPLECHSGQEVSLGCVGEDLHPGLQSCGSSRDPQVEQGAAATEGQLAIIRIVDRQRTRAIGQQVDNLTVEPEQPGLCVVARRGLQGGLDQGVQRVGRRCRVVDGVLQGVGQAKATVDPHATVRSWRHPSYALAQAAMDRAREE
jgi:hypothetical protein